MKKTVLIAALCLAVSCGTAFASDGQLIDKYQGIGARFLDILDGGAIPTHAELYRLMDANLQRQFTTADYERFKSQIEERYGVMKSAKFVAFERFDNLDELMYKAEFTKVSPALVHFGFDKNGKVQHFQVDLMNPMPQSQQGHPGAQPQAQ